MIILVIAMTTIFSIIVYTNAFFVKQSYRLHRKVILSIEELENQEYFLYLRSFDEDSFKNKAIPSNVFFPLGMPGFGKDEDLIKSIGAKHLIVKLNNQLIGDIDTSIIKVDETWKELVLYLIQKAKYIYVNPNDTDGLLWELKHIVEKNYLSKTIFLNSFGQSDLKKIVKLKSKKFFTLLNKEFGFEYPTPIRKEIPYPFFSVENNRIVFWTSAKRAMVHLDDLNQVTSA